MQTRLQINKDDTLNYYSITERGWMQNATVIPLKNICMLSPQERDTLLEYYRRTMKLGWGKRLKWLPDSRQ